MNLAALFRNTAISEFDLLLNWNFVVCVVFEFINIVDAANPRYART